LSLWSWDKFTKVSQTNDDLTKLYFNHYHRDSKAFEEDFEKDHNMDIITAKSELAQEAKFINLLANL